MNRYKVFKKDCIGRVPSSIKDLEECALCENEEICLSLLGVPIAEATGSGREERLGQRIKEK